VNGPRNLVLAVIFVILAAGFSTASDIYIAQSAAGGNTGADCADAHPVSWFNSSANWGSGAGQIGPGTTAHLCGTITTELAFQGSGSSGSVITLLFETGASVQISPGADANGAIGLGSHSYILIDGGLSTPCGWNTAANTSEGSCNGHVENMLYGSRGATCPGGACTTQATSGVGNLILGSGGSNIEIRNLQLGPSYIHNSMSDNAGTDCILLSNGSNWNVHDNKLHDGGWCLTFAYTSGSRSAWSITNNEMFNSSHMVAVGGANSASMSGLTMSGNYTHDMANWDTTADAWHANAIHMYGDGANNSTLTNVVISNNIMGGNPGVDMTAQIFSESQGSITNVYIFNNLLYGNPTVQGGERLLLYTMCMQNCYLLNNTLIANATGSSGANGDCYYFTGTISGWTVENNINGNCNTQAFSSAVLGGTFDYNANYRGNALLYIWDCNGSLTNTFSTWQSCSGEGSHSLVNLNDATGLNLNASYQPNSGSRVIGAAANLTNLCSGSLAGLCTDLAGSSRPNSGGWDIGAYHFQGGGQSPNPPTGLAAIVR
jgi:hypothetical protein